MVSPLLHLITTARWRAVLAAGVIEPAPGAFVHLSTPAQVALPATRLFAGRDDVLLLMFDPTRIGVEIRFEDGDPPHPHGLQFPHAYGPIPTAAVTAVVPYRPRSDGAFDAPGPLPTTRTERACAIEPSLLRRAATTEVPITGGVAVRTPTFPMLRFLNRLIVTGTADPDDIVAEAERALDGLPHRAALLSGSHLADVAAALRERGWAVEPEVLMAAAPGPGDTAGRVGHIDAEQLRPLWSAIRRDRYPGMDEAVAAQFVDAHAVQERGTDLRYLAAWENAQPVASCLLAIDGATAFLGPLDTLPAARGRGHGNALVSSALATAGYAGCDLVVLDALVDDWPQQWYARRGFVEVARRWSAYAVRVISSSRRTT